MKKLAKIYNDPAHPAGFTTAKALWLATRKSIPYRTVVEWLSTQPHYTLHRPSRKRFPRNFYNVSNIDDLWQTDLADTQATQNVNDGNKYVLVVIDVFSKYAWAVPLANKTGAAVTKAFKQILDESGRRPLTLQSDKGKEYLNATFQDMLKKREIAYFHTHNPDVKASVAERFIRTLKTRLSPVLTLRGSKRYLEVLPQVMHAYNHSIHSTIKMSPVNVKPSNVLEVWHNIVNSRAKHTKTRRLHSGKTRPLHPAKFKIGDHVLISKEKVIFAKGYEQNWSSEMFRIKTVIRHVLPVYIIEDLHSVQIEGTFYEYELQRVHRDDTTLYHIEQILASKGKRVKVRWLGYAAEFDSWIPASDIEHFSS